MCKICVTYGSRLIKPDPKTQWLNIKDSQVNTPSKTLTFIGAGNMARSIIGGLVKQGYSPAHIQAADPNTQALTELHESLGITACQNNQQATANADVVILAVKPQVMADVCHTIATALPPKCLVISIAAGITSASLEGWLGKTCAVVRFTATTTNGRNHFERRRRGLLGR